MESCEKTNEFQTEMAELIENIHRQSDGTQEKMSANAIKRQMDEILAKHDGRREYLGRDSKRFNQLDNLWKTSEKNAQAVRESYQQMRARMFHLSLQLAKSELSFVPPIKDFSIEIDENLFREVMQPWTDLIKSFSSSLSKLENRHAELETELSSLVPKNDALSEDDLLNDNISKHTAAAIKTEDQEFEFDVICGLIEKIEAAINLKKSQITDLQQCFTEALSIFVDAYTNVGLGKTAKELKTIIDADSLYQKRVTDVCSKISLDVGAKPNGAFVRSERTLPARREIFFKKRDDLRVVEKFIMEHNPN